MSWCVRVQCDPSWVVKQICHGVRAIKRIMCFKKIWHELKFSVFDVKFIWSVVSDWVIRKSDHISFGHSIDVIRIYLDIWSCNSSVSRLKVILSGKDKNKKESLCTERASEHSQFFVLFVFRILSAQSLFGARAERIDLGKHCDHLPIVLEIWVKSVNLFNFSDEQAVKESGNDEANSAKVDRASRS